MDSPDPRVGTVLAGRYRIVERATTGSMGVVYRGERTALKRPVAIKFLSEGYAASDDGLRRFEVEAKAMSRLEHPNCVPVIDYGVDDGAPYLVMDFIRGVTLRQLLATEWRLPPARAVAIMRQVASGLAHAHAQNIIHRDVKPENILVSPVEGHGEHVRIVDFGLAKLRDEGSFTSGMAVGTPSYMSPEQTIGERADQRADVYACGVILYELLTGTKPYQGEDPFTVMRLHREGTPIPLATAAAGVPISAGLQAVVTRAMARARDDRYPSMSELRAALDAVDEANPGRGRRRGTRVALIGVGLVAVAGAALAVTRPWQRRTTPASAGDGAGASAPLAQAAEPVAPVAADARPAPPPPPPAEPTTPPPASDDPPDDAVADAVTRLRERARGGNLKGAIAGLEKLRDARPGEALVQAALGNLYAEAQAWPKAVRAYLGAVRLDPAYKTDPRVIADLVEALGSRDAHRLAARTIERELGAAALPRLDEASRSTNRQLRTRARALRARLR